MSSKPEYANFKSEGIWRYFTRLKANDKLGEIVRHIASDEKPRGPRDPGGDMFNPPKPREWELLAGLASLMQTSSGQPLHCKEN